MKNLVRLPIAVGAWWLVMEASSRLGKLDFVKELIDGISWLDRARFTQGFLLVTALILGFILLKGKFGNAGFKGCKFKDIFSSMGIATITAMLFLVVMSAVMMKFGDPEGAQHPALTGSLLNQIISVWLIASFVEEFLFRGVLQGYLAPLNNFGIKLGSFYLSLPVVTSAILFSLMHHSLSAFMSGLMVKLIMVNTLMLGLIAGYYREKTGSLIPAYLAHLMFNVVGMMVPRLMMYLSGLAG